MKKKIIACITGLAIVAMIVPSSAQAVTAAELQEQIDALMATLTDLQAQLADLTGEPTGGITGCTITSFDRNLKVGMSGDDVKCLQVVLNSASDTELSAGVGSPGQETSYFGPKTKAAVIKFQEKYTADVLAVYGLTAGTGYVGTTTRAKLNTLLAAGEQEEEEEEEEEIPTGALGVSLASDTPVSDVIIAATTSGDGGQSLISFVKLTFTNNGSGDMKVTEVALTRIGIASDTDLSQLYLYEGNTKLAEYSSFDDKVVTFTSSTGIFTVSAGQSKGITLKGDLANGTSASRTIGFQLASADDVTSNAELVSGTFPLSGNKMTTATVADLGSLTVSHQNYSSTVDPGEINYELWQIKVITTNQKVQIERMKFTNVGTIDSDDIQNLKLEDSAGTQHGETKATLAADGTVTFDLSADPIVIVEGSTKYYSLKGDIVGGTNRSFKFSFQNMADLVVKDIEYGVYIRPNQADSWTIIEAAGNNTISTGSITITRASDSPSANIALDATNVELAKFDLKAVGEDVKITTLGVQVTTSRSGATAVGLDNVKLYLDGAQKDTTRDIIAEATDKDFSFGNTFVVKAGEISTLLIKGDVKDAVAGSFTAEDTIQITLSAGTDNAQGKTSLTSISTSAASGLTLTVKSGALTTSKNNAMADASSGAPSGVPGSASAKVASFTVLAGGGEGVDVSQFIFTDVTSAFDSIQNLVIKRQDTDEQIGTTRATLATTVSYSFYPSPKISLTKGEQIVVDVYADILTGATGDALAGAIILSQVSGTGQETGSDAKDATDRTGQAIYVAGAGDLTVTVAADTPVDAMLIMGETDQILAKFKVYEITGSEDVAISAITLTAVTNNNGSTVVTTDIKNIDLYDGSTLLATKADVGTSGLIAFSSLGWTIPAGAIKYLTVKADVGAYGSVTSGDDIKIRIASSAVTGRGVISGTAVSTVPASARNGKVFQISKAIPVITTSGVSLDGGSLINGTNDLFRFQVTATGGTVDFYQWEFTYATGGGVNPTTGTWSLYNNTEGANEDATCDVNTSTGVVTCIATSGEEIAAGSPETYTLKNDSISAANDVGDTISVYMNSDTTIYASGTTTDAADVVTAGDSLIWSDESDTGHTVSTTDWTNGYLLENDDEYTTRQSLSR